VQMVICATYTIGSSTRLQLEEWLAQLRLLLLSAFIVHLGEN